MHDQYQPVSQLLCTPQAQGSLLRKQQEHSTVTSSGAGGSPSLLAEQPVVHPSCWDPELFRILQDSRSTAAHFQEQLRDILTQLCKV